MKVRLTKKRLETLDAALSLDDILYEKFRRLNEELERKHEKLYKAERVMRVVQRRANGFLYVLPVLEVHTTPEGTEVMIGE